MRCFRTEACGDPSNVVVSQADVSGCPQYNGQYCCLYVAEPIMIVFGYGLLFLFFELIVGYLESVPMEWSGLVVFHLYFLQRYLW